KLLDDGIFNGNECLIYPLGAMSLDRLIENYNLMPLPRGQIQSISWQAGKAIEYMHSIGLIHTDIKPANMILVDARTTFKKLADANGETLLNDSIKIIDLDDAMFEGPVRRRVVGTEPYRAPEVTVGSVWSKPIDAFSFGCFIAELYKGSRLFASCATPEEQLASLERCVGLGITGYGRIAADRPIYFTPTKPYRVAFDMLCSGKAVGRIAAIVPLSVRPIVPPFDHQSRMNASQTTLRWPELLFVCQQLLRLDPDNRITVEQALSLPFFDSKAREDEEGGLYGMTTGFDETSSRPNSVLPPTATASE
ncbi:kinase-like domain-containing protein, partial [Mycena polygramma]